MKPDLFLFAHDTLVAMKEFDISLEASAPKGQVAVPEAKPLPEAGAAAPNQAQTPPQRQEFQSTTAPPPSYGDTPLFTWGGYFQAIGVILFLLGMLWFALRLVRRFGGGRLVPAPGALPKDALRMEAYLPLGPKRGLYVVRFMDARMVLGVTDHHVQLLSKHLLQTEDTFLGEMPNTQSKTDPQRNGSNEAVVHEFQKLLEQQSKG